MKTQTKQVVETIDVTIYSCDDCDYSSEYISDVERHYIDKHIHVNKIRTNEHLIYHFILENDAKLYMKYNSSATKSIDWVGPGWYIISKQHEYWAYGGEGDICTLIPVQAWIRDKQNDVQEIMTEVKEIRQAIRKDNTKNTETCKAD